MLKSLSSFFKKRFLWLTFGPADAVASGVTAELTLSSGQI